MKCKDCKNFSDNRCHDSKRTDYPVAMNGESNSCFNFLPKDVKAEAEVVEKTEKKVEKPEKKIDKKGK